MTPLDSPSTDIAISVRNLGKTYRLFGHPGDRIRQFFSLGLKQYHREFAALSDVSFDIRKGETVGIIGRNGSGKSTLLQLICGILKPTQGSVVVRGRVSALLELGAGFNPEFTGRENVYFQGTLSGFTRAQMEARFDEIASFADIGEFMDQPVRVYSSGMYVRLAFSVAVHLDPDILVVDEALGVGDLAYQVKSFRKIEALQLRGVTTIFVTHNLDQVIALCNRALWIDRGCLRSDATAAQAAFSYRHMDAELLSTSPANSAITIPVDGQRIGSGRARFEQILLLNEAGIPTLVLERNRYFSVQLVIHFLESVPSPLAYFTVSDRLGQVLFGISSLALAHGFGTPPANERVTLNFRQKMLLNPGEYFLNVGCQHIEHGSHITHDARQNFVSFQIHAASARPGLFDAEPELSCWSSPSAAPDNHDS